MADEAREALTRTLAQIISCAIDCEPECHDYPAGCGCAQEAARNILSMETHVLISREPTEADIEAMARAAYKQMPNVTLDDDKGLHTLTWEEAGAIEHDLCLDVARAAHAALVKADG